MSESFDRLVAVMARLRDPEDGCPWDIEQTFATIAPYTIEEAYEVADAISRGDMNDLRSELGDLLLQVVYHARMAEERDLFDAGDVAEAISDKMVRRHPHVFGSETVADAAEQTRAWEDRKAAERAQKAGADGRTPPSVLDGVAVGLPALTRALKLQKRAARVGFDWANARLVLEKLREEIAELEDELPGGDETRLADEVGDLLFTCVNVARQLGIDPETALRDGNGKFERRFRRLEDDLRSRGERPQDLTLEQLETAWTAAKRPEPSGRDQ